MNRMLFITGTGTEVGKTMVTAGLLRGMRRRGVDAVPMKPVQTGGQTGPRGFEAPDLQFSLETAGPNPGPEERALMNPYCYEPACSPHLAGRMAGHYPDIGHIVACAEKLRAVHDAVLIEGAGGLMVPLDESRTTLDLIQALGCPVLLVAHIGLGAINHTLLSVTVLRQAGIPLLGVVFNAPNRAGKKMISSMKTIRRWWPAWARYRSWEQSGTYRGSRPRPARYGTNSRRISPGFRPSCME